MQIIQNIRDKGSAIVIVVIALSLIGFILMDSRPGQGGLFSSNSTTVGKVNGQSIEVLDFNRRVKLAEEQQEQRSQQKPNTYMVREQMWNQLVAEKVFYDEAEKLGLQFTPKELSTILMSNDPSNPFLQQQGMTDPATGKLDVQKAQEALKNIKKLKGEQQEMVDAQIIEPLKLTSTVAKYSGLINASVYYPKWMQQKETAEAKNFAVISYVNIPYNVISDSLIKVTDEDINAYVKKNKELFKQEEGRMISYISFSQLADKADSLRIKNQLLELKAKFAADTNAKAFVARNTSAIEYDSNYVPKSKLPSTSLEVDSLVKLPAGSVYGPYVDKGNMIIAKVLGSKQLPDSVKARHILISLTNRETGQPIMEDSIGKKLADSILAAIKGGADFGALALKYSADGSKDKGGDLGTYGYGMMVPEFNEFTFNKPVGSKEVVKTQFGYHVIEIMSQKDFKPAYKIAFLAKEITPSDATINNASLAATKASAEKDAKALAAYAQKNGLKITQMPTIVKENDYMVGSLQDGRPLVKWAFDAKKGDVSEPFSIGDEFVVAMVDKTYEEGVQDAVTARSGAEVIIRNEKKAAMIINKIGNNPTLESAAAAYKLQVAEAGADSSITMGSQIINGIGVEPKVIGASFNKDYQAKPSPPITGTSGVYLIKVKSVNAKPADTPEEAAQKSTARLNALRSQNNNWYEGLKKLADIKDTRSKHY